MNIETKFEPGDKVWVLFADKVSQMEISEVKIECYKPGINAAKMYSTYNIWIYLEKIMGTRWTEEEVFYSKEELLKSL